VVDESVYKIDYSLPGCGRIYTVRVMMKVQMEMNDVGCDS
jgi:hypothetical protein